MSVRILIVDDRADKAKALASILTDLGQVLIAGSGKDALRLLLQHEFAVILLDVRMPLMDGFETAELIRRREATAGTPIIFITSFEDTQIGRGYSLGAVDFIVSPVVPEILRAKVSVFVDLYRKTLEVSKRADERIQLLEANLARASAEAARRFVEESHNRTAFLSQATARLSASLDCDAALDEIASLAAIKLADYCSIIIEHQQQRGYLAHRCAFEALAQMPQPTTCFAAHELLQEVLSSGRSLYAVQDPPRPMWSDTHKAPAKSLIIVPIRLGQQPLGTMTLASAHSGRTLSRPDLDVAEDLAVRIALSLENSRLYREAQAASRIKDEFLAMVSHELRTPLTPILSWTKLLASGKLDAKTTTQALQSIERSARAQTRLIEDLLDVTRATSGKLRLQLDQVDLVRVLHAALESVRPSAEGKGLQLSTDISAQSLQMNADESRLAQIFGNLLSNAVKFTPAKGHISLSLQASEDAVDICVADNGKGIEPRFLPLLFHRFSQADRTSTREHGGLGLGLSIVRHLVELHGGSVCAESAGLGQGTTFRVRLPLKHVPVLRGKSSSKSGRQRPFLTSRRILIVDDDPSSRDGICTLLEQHGAFVEEAASPSEALAILERRPVDLIITDICMPIMDGYELLRHIRNHVSPKLRCTSIIALTAFIPDEERPKAIAAGFQQCLSKPVDPDQLLAAASECAAVQASTSGLAAAVATEGT